MRRASPGRTSSTRTSGAALQEENNAPMMAIFGGVFGVLLVFLVVVNLYSDAAQRERLERGSEDGLYRIERLDGGSGYVVITFPDELRIIETGLSINPAEVCTAGSPFVDYARRVYQDNGNQLVFFMLEGSVPTMALARECLRQMWPQQVLAIGWVIADNELLKSVALNDIPDYIQGYAEPSP
ncbi:hypothetical protein [Candidatus Spongiihabitans sp.]|uniref:hypothetical protein n=1 Tax=Candidatus Spongiihabitans sp. TaxID=3101308 RepID=UPI003C7CB03C